LGVSVNLIRHDAHVEMVLELYDGATLAHGLVGCIVSSPHAFVGSNILISSNGPTSSGEGGVVLSQSHPIAGVASHPKKKKES
jgi:hypothetical protein